MRRVFPNDDELIGTLIRQRPQQDRVDDTKNGAVCADAEGKSNNCDDRESRILDERTQCKAQVLSEICEYIAPSVPAGDNIVCRGATLHAFQFTVNEFIELLKNGVAGFLFGVSTVDCRLVLVG